MVNENINFTEPKICDCGGNLEKQWYIYFSCTDLVRKETKQFRYKLGINRAKTLRQRKQLAKEALEAVRTLLYEQGFNPFDKSVKGEKKLLVDSLQNVLEIKNLSVRLRSKQTYKHCVDILKKWLEVKMLLNIEIGQFDKSHVLEFVDWLISELKYKGKTTNVMIGCLKTLFYMLVEREIIATNPFCVFKKMKEDEGHNVAFTPNEACRAIAYMKQHNIRLYYATQFVRYGFIRKTELTSLRVCDINLNNHTIVISAEASKNRRQDCVTIPKSLERIIGEMKLDKYNSEDYLFGRDLETGPVRLRRTADLSEAHREMITALGMRSELIFYGWKHTGCVELYNLTKDPYIVCRQCRHSDIRMTMKYLRSLGLGVNDAVRDW